MAQVTTEPQLDELKKRARRRLVGAVILAMIAAVVVPMLLESDPKPLGEDVSVRIPPVDTGRFVNKVGEPPGDKAAAPVSATPAKPLAEPAGNAAPPAKPEPVAEQPSSGAPAPQDAKGDKARASLSDAERRVIAPQARAPEAARSPPESVKASGEAKTPTDASKPATDATKPVTDAAKLDGNFSVQLAAFADDKGANALAGKLKRAGYNAYTEPYTTSRGTLWRVRVGPFGSRDAAESARDKLKGEGQNGIITAARQ